LRGRNELASCLSLQRLLPGPDHHGRRTVCGKRKVEVLDLGDADRTLKDEDRILRCVVPGLRQLAGAALVTTAAALPLNLLE
jgi:hypothetical protein